MNDGGPAGFDTGPTSWLGVLGPLQIRVGEAPARPFTTGPYKQRVVLGALLCRANQVVSVATLGEALWGDAPPRTAGKNIQVLVSLLRKRISGPGAAASPHDRVPGAADAAAHDAGIRLLHRPPGYLIEIGPGRLDLLEFQELVRAGRAAERAGDVAGAALAFGAAIGLWRGPMLPELCSATVIAQRARRLREQYLDVYESWAEAELALGRHIALLDGLNDLARRYPFRERLRSVQMLALYRCGRRAEALAQYETMRQLLARELGLAPSPVLARLYASLLGDDVHDAAGGNGGRGGQAGFQGSQAAAKPSGTQDRRCAPALTGESPAVTAELGDVRVRLPRELTDFTGRRAQTAALLAFLGDNEGGRGGGGGGGESGGVAVLSGPAGAGKTVLAVHCAHRLAHQYPHGRVLVRLRGADGMARSISEVLGDLLRVLVPEAETPRGLDDRAAALRERLGSRRVLFVLDDAVTEVQVRSVLWAIGECAALVTSRRRLAGLEGAAHYGLNPLPEPEALELLGRLIGPARLAADPAGARRIAAACGGLPLALRIAGAKLAGLRHLPLTRFAERLADGRRMLEELTAGDLRVRPALAMAYQDLSPGDQAALTVLAGAPREYFTGAEAASLLGMALTQAETAIERLIEAHLVEALPMPDAALSTAVPDDLAGPVAEDQFRGLMGEEHDVFAQCAEPIYRLLPLIRVFVRDGRAH